MRPDDQWQLRSGVGESTIRSSVVLVVVAVFVSLTAGAVAGAAVGTSGDTGAPGAGAGTVASAPVAGSAGAPTPGYRVGVQYRQAGDGDGQSGDSSVSICERVAQRFVSVYNSQTDSVPGLVSNRVEDSNVHLQVDNDSDRNYTMVTNEEGQVTEYSVGKPESASLRVETDCATFQEITDSERPTETFRVAYAEDRIRFIGLGTVNSVFFAGLDRLTDPIAWGVLLVLFVLVLVVLYLFYRRLTLYYRNDDDEDEDGPDEGGGSPPGDGATGGGPPDPNTRSGHPPGQNQEPPGRGRGTGDGPEPRPDDRSDSRSSDPRPGDRRG
jgi:hypothetical protein